MTSLAGTSSSSIVSTSPVYFAIARIDVDDGQRIYDFAHFRDFESDLCQLKEFAQVGNNHTDRRGHVSSGCFLTFNDAIEWLDRQDQAYRAESDIPFPWRPVIVGVAAHADDKGGRKRDSIGQPRPAVACAAYFGDGDCRNFRQALDADKHTKQTAELYGVRTALQRAPRFRDLTVYLRHKSAKDVACENSRQWKARAWRKNDYSVVSSREGNPCADH
ncbi:hypothetical protein POJ06DRAFT_112120 [Lipomyces tetrasporus]|uniref:Uncharacterized protein n=1 Tax=Lipomyces tetrasporus TaxID=54092 RepID=A0AAD7QSU8_9ASCO|nr:uncharacterized protein POJ06DRAFT_112120 [Lipomyces tetrasporus]KAJ8100820.1 hypothetical protein POJ06DRAFT_112120 [Lipomyces tetrasporus]